MPTNTSDSSGTQDEPQSSQTRAKRSKVWEFYEPNLVSVDNILKAVCKYCGMQLSTRSGTSSLRSHIAEYCANIDEPTRKRFAETLKKPPSESSVFDPQLSHERMIDFIIHAEIPFNKFEDPYFEPWIQTLQPTLKSVRREIVRNDCLKKFEKMKDNLRIELLSLDTRVCLTSNMWTSAQNLGYMVITAHYIDVEFKLKKKIICVKNVKYPCTAFAIEEAIVSCLIEWSIRDRIFTLTIDNASNNTSAREELVDTHKTELMLEGVHFQVKCCVHIFNILAQDAMKVIDGVIHKIRELLKHIYSSPSEIEAFNAIAVVNGLASKFDIALDIPNQWNSTLAMIGEALKCKAVLNNYANQYGEFSLNEEEWSRVETIFEFLKVLEEATYAVSVDRKPTAHLLLPLVLQILHALNDPSWQINDTLKELSAAMKAKFENYWGPDESKKSNARRKKRNYDFNLAIVIATLLDPRRKCDYLEFFYQKIYMNTNQVNMCVDSALEWMKKYFIEYQQSVRRPTSYQMTYSSGSSSSTVGSLVLGKRQLEVEFASFKSHRRMTRAPKSEIETYLEEDSVTGSKGFDILLWWETHAEKLPVLSTMARDFLAIPLSSVSSESAFSLGGRILGEARSSLTIEVLEALVCGKDWLFNEKHMDNEGQFPNEGNSSRLGS